MAFLLATRAVVSGLHCVAVVTADGGSESQTAGT